MKRFLTKIRDTLAWLAAGGRQPSKLTPEALRQRIDRGEIRKVLIIRQNQKIGDTLLATAAVNLLRERFPSLSIHWLASRYNKGALEGHPGIARLWCWHKDDPLPAQGRLWRAIRQEQYPLAIVLFSHTPSLTSFLLARLSGARCVYAFDSTSGYGGNHWSRYLAHTEIPLPPEAHNEAEKFADLVRPLIGRPGPAIPSYHPAPADETWAEQEWQKSLGSPTKPVVVLFTGGTPSRPDRLWPAACWVKLAQLLRKQGLCELALLGCQPARPGMPPTEEAVAIRSIQSQMGFPVVLLEAPTLGRIATILKPAALLVTTDGGVLHLAVCARVPTLGLFFSTDPDRWAAPVPWASHLRAPGGHPESLTPDRVLEAIAARLNAQPGTPA